VAKKVYKALFLVFCSSQNPYDKKCYSTLIIYSF